MIALRRGGERQGQCSRARQIWHTFNSQDPSDPLAAGFGTLEELDEARLAPGAGVPPHRLHEAEIVTYVREGTLAYGDSTGRSAVIPAGEFHCLTAGRGLRHRQRNAAPTGWAHVFQIWLRPAAAELESSCEQQRFSAAQRRGALCVVASPDARRGSLRLHPDALIYAALLEPGQHVVHPLQPERRAWLHVVQGEASLGDCVLTTGDGAGVTAERAVSLTAREETEILLLDLGTGLPRPDRG